MRKTLILTVLMFIAAGLAPTVFADDDGNQTRKEKAKENQEKAQERREEAKEKAQERKDGRGEGHGMRFLKTNTSLELNGTAVGKDNATYTFTLSADGKGIERVKVRKDRNATDNATANGTSDPAKFRYHARLLAHIVVKDANGTIVKEGDVRVQLFAKSDGNQTKWILGSVEKKAGMPHLVLKGNVSSAGEGSFDLEGKGKIVFKAGEESRASPAKVTAVSGTFSRN